MAVASLSHDNQRHLKAMQFVVQFLDNSEAYFDAEVNVTVYTSADAFCRIANCCLVKVLFLKLLAENINYLHKIYQSSL